MTDSVMGSGVDTRGWDTVSASRFPEINASIKNSGTTPSDFADTFDQDGKTIFVKADFRPWQLTPDGDSAEITLLVEVESLEITADGKTKKFPTAEAHISARLELLPTDIHEVDGGRKQLLVMAAPTKEDPISVDSSTIDGGGFMDEVKFETGLSNWLNKNAKKFTHVFAAISIHKVVEETAAYKWLKPTYAAYAVGRNSSAPEQSVLALIAMTEHRKPSGLAFQVEQNIIPKDDRTAFAISRKRVLREMIASSLPTAYEGLKFSDLAIDDEHGTIRLKEGARPKVKNVDDKGKTYHVLLERLDITLNETSLTIETSTITKLALGVSSVCDGKVVYGLKITQNKNGQDTLGFDTISEDEPKHRTIITDARKNTEKWLAIAAGIIFVIGAAIVALVYFFPALVAASVIGFIFGVSLVAAAAAGLLHLQQLAAGKEGKPLNTLLIEEQLQITWCSGAHFAPRAAVLNGALQISGKFELPQGALTSVGPVAFQKRYADIMQARAA